jgi:hypothetical protein
MRVLRVLRIESKKGSIVHMQKAEKNHQARQLMEVTGWRVGGWRFRVRLTLTLQRSLNWELVRWMVGR